MGAINGVAKKIRAASPTCVHIHCIIHREDLVAKRHNESTNAIEKTDFELLLDDVKLVYHIRQHAKKHRIFREICKNMEVNYNKVPNRVLALREQLYQFFNVEANSNLLKF